MKKKFGVIVLVIILVAVVAGIVIQKSNSTKTDSVETSPVESQEINSEPKENTGTVENAEIAEDEANTEMVWLPEVDNEGNIISENNDDGLIPEASSEGTSSSEEYVPNENELPPLPMPTEDLEF